MLLAWVVVTYGSNITFRTGSAFVVMTTGWFLRVHVGTAMVCAVGQAGGVLLSETIRVAGLGRGMAGALWPWRKLSAVLDPG